LKIDLAIWRFGDFSEAPAKRRPSRTASIGEVTPSARNHDISLQSPHPPAIATLACKSPKSVCKSPNQSSIQLHGDEL
jgi:hypothetical protein